MTWRRVGLWEWGLVYTIFTYIKITFKTKFESHFTPSSFLFGKHVFQVALIMSTQHERLEYVRNLLQQGRYQEV